MRRRGFVHAGAGLVATAAAADVVRRFAVLGINDVYRIEGTEGGTVGGLARVRALWLRLEARLRDLLVLHAGDALAPSLLSRTYAGAQMIDVLNHLDGDGGQFDGRMFATFGNHEFDRARLDDAPAFAKRLAESGFTWLGSNVRFAVAADGTPLISAPTLRQHAMVTVGGVRVGLFGLTTDASRPAYVAAFTDPVATARRLGADLRGAGAEVVIAVTHLALAEDRALLATLGAAGPDLVIGGHEHVRLAVRVHGRLVAKADSDAASATLATIAVERGRATRIGVRHIALGPGAAHRRPPYRPGTRRRASASAISPWDPAGRPPTPHCRRELTAG